MEDSTQLTPSTPLPRVTIEFCTQCKWMLRAAYLAQELLSTFSTSLGEVALQPSTGGTFIINLYLAASTASSPSNSPSVSPQRGISVTDEETSEKAKIQKHLIWDRRAEGGFPETKILKRLIRNHIDPTLNLGHIDATQPSNTFTTTSSPTTIVDSTTPTAPASVSIPDPERVIGSAIPKALHTRLLSHNHAGGSRGCSTGERKFTPMDIDSSTPGSRVVSSASGVSDPSDEVKDEDETPVCEDGCV